MKRLLGAILGATLLAGCLVAPASASPARTQAIACHESDLSSPSADTYCLLKQWLYVQHHGAPHNGTMFDNGTREKEVAIASLAMGILGSGSAYFPLHFYPALTRAEVRTAWVLFTRHVQDRFNDNLVNALYRAYRCGCDTR